MEVSISLYVHFFSLMTAIEIHCKTTLILVETGFHRVCMQKDLII